MVPWWWLVVAFVAGAVVPLAAAALVYVKAFREFDREIKRKNDELGRRIANGCRRIVPPQGGSGTAPPKRL